MVLNMFLVIKKMRVRITHKRVGKFQIRRMQAHKKFNKMYYYPRRTIFSEKPLRIH